MVTDHSSSSEDRQRHARSPARAEFAERLRVAIERKGWTTTEAARRVSHHLGRQDKFSRAHLWQYLQGKSLPRARYLRALSRALDLRPEDLVPGTSVPRRRRAAAKPQPAPPGETKLLGCDATGIVHVRDYGDGTALVQVSERVQWEMALAVIELLKGPSDDAPSS